MSDPHVHAEPRSPAEANNRFAVEMYGHLRDRPGNLLFSPFSLRTALAVAHAGARGGTATEMARTLWISPSNENQRWLSDIVQRLEAGGEHEVVVSTSLWMQDGVVQATFLDVIAREYHGAAFHADFRDHAEAARLKINRSIEEATRGRISRLLPPGSVDGDTRIVLANAVYLKAKWALQFSKQATHRAPFDLDNGSRVEVELMARRATARYANASTFQAVELEYRGGDVSMIVLLPHRGRTLIALEQRLFNGDISEGLARMETHTVDLFLPRFKIRSAIGNMREHLSALGMPAAFSRVQADFSGINGHRPPDEDALCLAAVYHKADVEVTEEGTEAAAATALVPVPASARLRPEPIEVFRADHPFLFLIQDRQTGAILFLGRVADPSAED